MATIEEKESRIKEAFDGEDIAVNVQTVEDAHNRNLVHKVSTVQNGEEQTGEIVSSFDEPVGEGKLDFLVQSFPNSSQSEDLEEADETYGDTEGIE